MIAAFISVHLRFHYYFFKVSDVLTINLDETFQV